MKKLLIITHLPFASPRIPGLAAYLPEFGWEPVVLTPKLPARPDAGFRVVETDTRDFLGFLGKPLGLAAAAEDDMHQALGERLGGKWRRPLDCLLNAGGALLNYPDVKRGWRPFAIAAGRVLLGNAKFHALMSSSLPVTAHIVAKELKREYGLPWLADLRDLWSQNHNYSYGPLRRALDRRLEKKTLAAADVLMTVSPPWAAELASLHRGKKVETLSNGFDPAARPTEAATLTAEFSITYTGRIYQGKQDVSGLFTALAGLIAEDLINPDRVAVRFYGPVTDWLATAADAYGLTGIVRQHGLVSPEEARQRQRESQLLWLLDWEDAAEKGVYPGKIYEYLAAGRPVLATGGSEDGVIRRLLKETGGGTHAITAADIRQALRTSYEEYRRRGSVAAQGRPEEIEKYSYRTLAGLLAARLDALAAGAPS